MKMTKEEFLKEQSDLHFKYTQTIPGSDEEKEVLKEFKQLYSLPEVKKFREENEKIQLRYSRSQRVYNGLSVPRGQKAHRSKGWRKFLEKKNG